MLDLRRLRLLRELHERGTIAAVADALQFTPSAVSQQLAMLERETGVRAARARRPRRAADRPGARARRARRRAARARRARRGRPRRGGADRHRPRADRGLPVRRAAARAAGDGGARRATRRGCAASSSRPSPSRRCPRSRSATSTSCSATSGSTSRGGCRAGLERHELLRDPVHLALPVRHPPARRHRDAVPLAELAGEAWTTGHPGMGWEEMTQRTCREHGGFEPDIRHRTNDATVSLALVARGLAVDAAARPRAAAAGIRASRCAAIAGAPCSRAIFAVTRDRRRRAAVDAGAARRRARRGGGAVSAGGSGTASQPHAHPRHRQLGPPRRGAHARALGRGGLESVGLDVLPVAVHDDRRLGRRPRGRAPGASRASTRCCTPRRCTSRTSPRTARQDFVDTNVTGTLNLLEEAVAAGVGRFVFTSTTTTFGRALTPPAGAPAAWITEDVVPVPKNIYGATKVAAEDLCELVHRDHGLPCVVLRTSRFFPEADDRDDGPRRVRRPQPQGQRAALPARRPRGRRQRAPARARPRAARSGSRRLIISATTPFTRDGPRRARRRRAGRRAAPRAPRYEAVYAARGWRMFPALDRVYVNERARGRARLGAALRLRRRPRAARGRRGPAQPARARGRREGLPRGVVRALHDALSRPAPTRRMCDRRDERGCLGPGRRVAAVERPSRRSRPRCTI